MRFHDLASFLALAAGVPSVRGHGGHSHGDHDHEHHHHSHSLRGLQGNPFSPPGLCNHGDPKFPVGKKEYACEAEFNAAGGQCRTADSTAEEKAARKEKFKQWKEAKEKGHKPVVQSRGRRLNGCTNCVDWDGGQVITIPVAFHHIHDGTAGRKYTCEYTEQAGFTEPFPGTSDCDYAKNSIEVMNAAFRGKVSPYFQQTTSRSYPVYPEADIDSQIQFCLQEVTTTDNAAWYADDAELDMKRTLDVGGKETLNIWTNTASGYLGYAYFVDNNDFDEDGVVLLHESMPNGDAGVYAEGDTLTHEVGHWLNLEHTHAGGCRSGPGDYMSPAAQESRSSSGCPVDLDDCGPSGKGGRDDDGAGPNPIHNFMAYTYDSCMDEFTPGQKEWMQSTWETYRHLEGTSETIGLAADGVTCTTGGTPPPATPPPTPPPTLATPPPTPPPVVVPTPSPPTGSPPTGSPPTCNNVGDACSVDGDCCGNKCRGKSGSKTCK